MILIPKLCQAEEALIVSEIHSTCVKAGFHDVKFSGAKFDKNLTVSEIKCVYYINHGYLACTEFRDYLAKQFMLENANSVLHLRYIGY